ncbi:MAG: ABC transporter transmembrane domain-containing protein, partial [Fenollaria timonensis]
ILLSIGDVVCVAVYPYLLSWIVDHFESLTPHDIFRCVGLLLLSVLLTLVIQYGNKIVKVRFETKIMSQLRSSLFHQILRLENSTFQASKIESYTTFLLNDLDDFYALFFENGIYFFNTCVMLLTYTVVLYMMSPIMCVFVMGSLLLVLFLPSLLGKKFDPLTKKHMESRKDYVARTEELLRSHELYTKEMAEKSEHLELMKLTQMQSKKAILGRYRSLVQILSGSTLYIQLLLCFGVGLFLVVQDVISIGVLASSLIYVEYVSMSSVNLVDELLEMKSARAYYQRIQSLQGKKERSFLSLPLVHQTLHLEKIAYHVGNKVLLHPISVTFDPGKKYLITGPNGSGNSTLLKIVAGLLEP